MVKIWMPNDLWYADPLTSDEFDTYPYLTEKSHEDWRLRMSLLRFNHRNGIPYENTAFYFHDLERHALDSFKKLIPVNEWWGANFLGNLVEVEIHYRINRIYTNCVTVRVRGTDDFSMMWYRNFDFNTTRKENAIRDGLAQYNRIGAFVTRQELLSWDFIYDG